MNRAVSILFLTLVIGVLSGAAAPQDNTAGCFNGADLWMREDILVQVNRAREKNGLGPVTCDGALSDIAQGHAEDMGRRDYFNHTNPEGKSPFDRLRDAGVSYHCAAENIAWGDDDATTLVRRWMGSPGHRKNILGDFTKVGIGSYDRYYVLMLIRE